MWEWFIGFLTQVLAGIAGFCGDWGLAIILLTFIIRILLTPLTIKSTRSSAQMQVLQPRMMEIQERYADDPVRQQEELRKIYSEHKFNPLGGCLPLFLQMPVFFALFTVLKNVPSGAHFYNILPALDGSCAGVLASGGIGAAWVYILLDVLFGALTFLPMYLNTRNSAAGQQQSQTLVMGVVMAGMMMWFGWTVPVGVGRHPAALHHQPHHGEVQEGRGGAPGQRPRSGERGAQGEGPPPPQEVLDRVEVV